MMITPIYTDVILPSGHIKLSVKVIYDDYAVIYSCLKYLVSSSEVFIVLVIDKLGMTMCLVCFWSPF